ncbi:MAG: radical SAM protein [Candidatus Woesearchaeota archaeon]|jgi:MoaA/NifB/PqqE/SkfB family radical SAM enzyme
MSDTNRRVVLRGNGTFTSEQFERVLRHDDSNNLMLTLGLTTGPGCNLRCAYCYNHGGIPKDLRERLSKRMVPNEYTNAIVEAAKLGAGSVIIVGIGETLMDPNIKEILQTTHDHGMTPVIVTNITDLVDQKMAQFLFDTGTSICASVDSVQDPTYSRIVGREGMLHKTLAGIDNCLRAGYGGSWEENGHLVTNIAFNAMAMKCNEPELEGLNRYCEEKEILFMTRTPSPLKERPSCWDEVVGTSDDLKRIDGTVKRLYDGRGILGTQYGCLFWVSGIILGIDGEARLCYAAHNKAPMGNVRDMSLAELIYAKHNIYPVTGGSCPLKAGVH